MKKSFITTTTAAVLLGFGGANFIEASETNNVQQEQSNVTTEQVQQEEQDLTNTLSAIEKMPNSVIDQGEPAIDNYLQDNGVDTKQESNKEDGTITREASVGSVSACAGSVGYAAVTNLTPAKILKVKSAIKTVGGATKFVNKMKPAYKAARKTGKSKTNSVKAAASKAASKAGPDTKEALLDFFGISTIVGSCSALFEK